MREQLRRVRTRRRVGVGAVGAVIALTGLAPPAAAAEVGVTRLGGDDRYATAAAVAGATTRAVAPGRDTVVVARGTGVDALSAVNLTSPPDGIGVVVLSGADRLPGPGAAVVAGRRWTSGVVLGSEGALGPGIARELAEGGAAVTRLGGADRYATNLATVASGYGATGRAVGTLDGRRTAILVSGAGAADAVSAGPLAAREHLPLLLTTPDTLAGSARAALSTGAGTGARIDQVVVVGGRAAVSDRVVEQLRTSGVTVRRLDGSNRQETALRVLTFAKEEFGWTVDDLVLARGDDQADALAAAAWAGRRRAPVVLTAGRDDLGPTTRAFLQSRAGSIRRLDVLGSAGAVSDRVLADARVAAQGVDVAAVTAAELGASWRAGCPVGPGDLRRVTVPYVDLAGVAHRGDLVVHADVAAAAGRVFGDLYRDRFPIASIRPVSEFGGSDDASMDADNTSAFNCRAAVGGTRFSEHSYGTAVDVNPVENPYVRGSTVLPAAGRGHLDRRTPAAGRILAGDATVEAFRRNGFSWGGSWQTLKDYQHFSTSGR